MRFGAARAENGVAPGKWITAVLSAGDKTQFINEQKSILCALARLGEDEIVVEETAVPLNKPSPSPSAKLAVTCRWRAW